LSTEPQTGRIKPDDRIEADAILEAERLGYVQNARRPNLDFKVDGGWADVKTPVSSPYRTLSQQAEDIATKSNLYDSDVKVILNLKNLDDEERYKFIEDVEAAGADMSKIYTVF
jgi:hypothetical protein